MAATVPDVLAAIVRQKKAALPELFPQMEAFAERGEAMRGARRGFLAALQANPPAVIAEVKKASPSKGVFTEDFRPAETATRYAQGGAAAISVLTDEQFFQGSLADLEAVRAAVALPVLRKDFTIHEVHVHQAAAHGADAILLIAAILTAAEMRSLRELAAGYGMAAIVEVHDEAELEAALDSGPAIVGVNNRNLHTFEVTLDTSLRLAERIPADILRISESGIHTNEDVRLLQQSGYQAFLVGEHLMRSGDATQALRVMRGQQE
ncbi:MAG: indole-3-glycerol phosphate synthase TrpC [Bryobacterales bacterium]|nr:indole-3-glycerol phosphate synthase TrpC [Bryobacterales bacterium]